MVLCRFADQTAAQLPPERQHIGTLALPVLLPDHLLCQTGLVLSSFTPSMGLVRSLRGHIGSILVLNTQLVFRTKMATTCSVDIDVDVSQHALARFKTRPTS